MPVSLRSASLCSKDYLLASSSAMYSEFFTSSSCILLRSSSTKKARMKPRTQQPTQKYSGDRGFISASFEQRVPAPVPYIRAVIIIIPMLYASGTGYASSPAKLKHTLDIGRRAGPTKSIVKISNKALPDGMAKQWIVVAMIAVPVTSKRTFLYCKVLSKTLPMTIDVTMPAM